MNILGRQPARAVGPNPRRWPVALPAGQENDVDHRRQQTTQSVRLESAASTEQRARHGEDRDPSLLDARQRPCGGGEHDAAVWSLPPARSEPMPHGRTGDEPRELPNAEQIMLHVPDEGKLVGIVEVERHAHQVWAHPVEESPADFRLWTAPFYLT